jgi:hypothetical protein
MDMDEQTIKIRDLGLASAVASCGFEVREIQRDASGQAYFLFKKTDELDCAVSAYWADTLKVRARYHFDAIKMLKSRIYAGR